MRNFKASTSERNRPLFYGTAVTFKILRHSFISSLIVVSLSLLEKRGLRSFGVNSTPMLLQGFHELDIDTKT